MNSDPKEKTRKYSIIEGSFASIMSGAGDSYVGLFALELKANIAQIGFLSSLPSILSPISQVIGSRIMEKTSRKTLLVRSVLFQASMWLPIMILAFLYWLGMFQQYLPWMLILFYSLYATAGALGGPAWFSLLGDAVPENIRGKYFALRNKICGRVSLVSFVLAAFLLDFTTTQGYILLGFATLFAVAGISRITSCLFFTKHEDFDLTLKKDYYFSFFQFIRKAHTNNFGKFTLFAALMNFAVAISSPFFVVYMKNDLAFTYTQIMMVNLSAAVFSLLAMPLMGRLSDKYGNRELLRLSVCALPFVPLFWLFSDSVTYLALVPQFVGGIAWAAFSFAASNFIYDAVTPARRGICVAYYNVLSGVGIFVGASTGGMLSHYVNITFMNPLLFLFLLSGILRFLVIAFMLPKIHEVREVHHPHHNVLMYWQDIHPEIRGLMGTILSVPMQITQKFKKIYK